MDKKLWTPVQAKDSYNKFTLRAQLRHEAATFNYQLIDKAKCSIEGKQIFRCHILSEFQQMPEVNLRSDYPCNKCAYAKRILTGSRNSYNGKTIKEAILNGY
ncbi:hypothetical protein NVP2275O_068 [Vibrio phage 2.275.O._10N.286.54.E11]|nr:hypothetical protein NVP2275O_068 [Vibrio phage 2.275.O._10N.286.54.E11]